MTPRPLAVVTGGGAGIGCATALQLARDGYDLLVADRDGRAASETCALIVEAGGTARARIGDLTCAQVRADLVAAGAGADVLVNNAGIFYPKDFDQVDSDDLRRVMEINVIALFELAQGFARQMPRGGRIVNLASRAVLGARGYSHYVASKSAVAGLTRAMALELAPRGLRVNAVAPGVIDTAMTAFLDPAAREKIAAGLPVGRIGQPEDVAAAVAFFASPQSGFVTGQILLVDGGSSVGGLPPI